MVSLWPALIFTRVHIGKGLPSSLVSMGAPHNATTAAPRNFKSGPLSVISNPSVPAAFPTRKLAIQKASGSMGPEWEKPRPMVGLPGQSSIKVYAPPARTSIADGENLKEDKNFVIVLLALNSGSCKIVARNWRLVGGPQIRDSIKISVMPLMASSRVGP